ncbi:MAG: transglycosylase domain-containing protein [Cyclobacteriaceae bacterium]|nr:transglycosylase domain-containing protein [Cyclobacteriaceae bacterium]
MSTSASSTDTIKKKISDALGIQRPWFRNVVKYCWIVFLCFILGLPLYVYTVSIDLFGLFGGMPSLADVENPENDLSSELISADGVSLGRYFRFNRSQVNYNELSDELVNTLVLSEDHRFYQHSGLDFPAYLRVVFGLLTLNPSGGGSTITQQLAKNLYTRNPDKSLDGLVAKLGRYPRRIVQKTKEWIISIDLERNFTKQEIIAMYLNTAEFSSNTYGIKVASETYFNKPPDSLNLQESALLVGMLQNPTFFNPVRRPENALQKRNEVLYKIYNAKYKITTREQYDSLKSLDLGLKFKIQDQNEGLATYFRTVISAYLMDYCAQRGIDLWNSGLKIYTTIDSKLQKYAEEAVNEKMKILQGDFYKQWEDKNPWVDDDYVEIPGFLKSRIKKSDTYKNLVARYGEGSDSVRIMLNLKKPMTVFSWKGERDTLFSSMDSLAYYKKFLQTGLMSMDPNTGHIKAWVGGFNYKYFKFDHVKQAKRQPGSTFKPFVYGLAMESGYSPCYVLEDIAPSFGNWYPMNSDGTRGNGEKMTIRQAMARSINSITAQVMKSLGEANVVEFAHRVGIESQLDPVPSLCLGVSDVSLFEMVGAYSTYVNNGIHTEPFFITRIEDKNGNIIENFVPKTKQAVNDQTAYKMIYMLMGGVEESGGTSAGLSYDLKKDNEIGGKTGTTNNASDGWYMGVTHDLVTGVWVGGDERAIHFRSWAYGQGGKTARPIWDAYMTKVYKDPTTGITKGKFRLPKSGLDISLDCAKFHQPDSLKLDEKPWEINN